jgi:Tol biopolymer transport system component
MVWPQEPYEASIKQQLWLHTLASDQHEVALAGAPPETRRGEIAWSPDGRTLLYEFYEEPSQRLSIRALDLATGQTRLLIDSASQASFSQTGQLAYLTHDYRWKTALWMADGDGRNAREIVPYSANYAMHSPRLSPDGQRVVFSALLPEKTSSQLAPQQSSASATDFQRIAARQQTSLPNYDLWIAMADGSGVRGYGIAPSNEIGPGELQCNWYPDGQQIVFASAKGIFRLPLTGSNQLIRIGAASQATGLYLTT